MYNAFSYLVGVLQRPFVPLESSQQISVAFIKLSMLYPFSTTMGCTHKYWYFSIHMEEYTIGH